MSLLIFVPIVFIMLCSIAAVACIGVWTYRDAKARGLNAVLWVIVVLLVPSLIGLIVYLVAGRNQSVALCPSCSGSLSASNKFCPKCGTAFGLGADGSIGAAPLPIGKTNRGPLIAFIICIALVVLASLAAVGIGVFGGLIYSRTGGVTTSEFSNVSVGRIENNIGNNWSITFMRTQGEQKKQFNITSQDTVLVVDSKLESGSLRIQLFQDGKTLSYALTGGNQQFSLSQFSPGSLEVTLIADNAQNGSVIITVK